MMTGNSLKYLCAVLNSPLIGWFMKRIARTTGLGTPDWNKYTVEAIPIPQITEIKQRHFSNLTHKIMKANRSINHPTNIEAQLNRLVCKLYNLTKEEIALIIG